jgi:hypothetical protein
MSEKVKSQARKEMRLVDLGFKFKDRIDRYRLRQQRTPNIEKRKVLGAKIRATKECLQDVGRMIERLANEDLE